MILSPKKLGLCMLVAGPLIGIAYSLGIINDDRQVVELTAMSFVLILVGVMTWIGYTMFTEPVSARPIRTAVENSEEGLEPETINASLSSPSASSSSQNGPLAAANATSSFSGLMRPARTSFSIVTDCSIGEGTLIRDQVNLYKCRIGKECKIESFVYIEEGVKVGDRCKIKPNVFIPTGVTIEDGVFIGPNVTFTNDKYPRASNDDFVLRETKICKGASIGAHAVILPGVKIGEDAIVGAGAVVTKDVPPDSIAIGNPARILAKSTTTIVRSSSSETLTK